MEALELHKVETEKLKYYEDQCKAAGKTVCSCFLTVENQCTYISSVL